MTLTERFSDACGAFDFDLAGPLFEQIFEAFQDLKPLALSAENLSEVKERPGVYGLDFGGRLVYVGKADGDARSRLTKHRSQLLGRVGIGPDAVAFRCLYLSKTWDPFQPESHLIAKMRPSWNSGGFGPNDPGRQRDSTKLKGTHWHVLYPLDSDCPCSGVASGQYSVLDLLREVAKDAPFWVRFQGNRKSNDQESEAQYEVAQADFAASRAVIVPRDGLPAKDLLLLAVAALPDPTAWQLSQLPSHLLLYREANATYPRMTRLWPPT